MSVRLMDLAEHPAGTTISWGSCPALWRTSVDCGTFQLAIASAKLQDMLRCNIDSTVEQASSDVFLAVWSVLQVTFLNTNLGHLCQIQWRPLFVCVGWSPALHTDLLVVEDTGLWATARETPLSTTALQLWSGVGGAEWRGSTGLREADLFMREVEGLHRGLWGQGHGGGGCQTSESWGAGETLGEAGHLQGVGAGRQAEAGATLHGWEAELHVTNDAALNAAAAVAPPLLHCRPHTRALRAPGRAATAELVWAGQGPALPLAGRRSRVWRRGLGQTKVLQQAGDCAWSGADIPVPVGWTLVHLRQDIPQALQAGSYWPLLYSTAMTHLMPPTCLCNEKNRHIDSLGFQSEVVFLFI